MLNLTDAQLAAELAAVQAESMGWTPVGEGTYVHLGNPHALEEEEVVVQVVGVPDVAMAGGECGVGGVVR